MKPSWARHVAPLCALGLGGCAVGYRVGAGPTFDTQGRVGGEVFAGLSFGVYLGDGHAIQESIGGSGGMRMTDGAGVLAPRAGLEYLYQDDDLAWRAGLTSRFGFTFAEEGTEVFIGPGVEAALLATLDDDGDLYHDLGVSFAALAGGGADGGALHGLFCPAVVYETNILMTAHDFIGGKR